MSRRIALDRVIDATIQTAEYIRQVELELPLTASDLEGNYRLLADFKGTVLAGHPTQYDIHLIPKLL